MYLVQTRNLHSTIFILIPNPSCQYPPKQTFTFYYIYINTDRGEKRKMKYKVFTFYYIYINT